MATSSRQPRRRKDFCYGQMFGNWLVMVCIRTGEINLFPFGDCPPDLREDAADWVVTMLACTEFKVDLEEAVTFLELERCRGEL